MVDSYRLDDIFIIPRNGEIPINALIFHLGMKMMTMISPVAVHLSQPTSLFMMLLLISCSVSTVQGFTAMMMMNPSSKNNNAITFHGGSSGSMLMMAMVSNSGTKSSSSLLTTSSSSLTLTCTSTSSSSLVLEMKNTNYPDILQRQLSLLESKDDDDDDNENDVHHHRLVLVDCYTPWCGPCRLMEPVLEEFAATAAAAFRKRETNVEIVVCRYNTEQAAQGASSSSLSSSNDGKTEVTSAHYEQNNFKVELALQGCLVRALPALILLDTKQPAVVGNVPQVLDHWTGCHSVQELQNLLQPHVERAITASVSVAKKQSRNVVTKPKAAKASTHKEPSSSSSSSSDTPTTGFKGLSMGAKQQHQQGDDYMLCNEYLLP